MNEEGDVVTYDVSAVTRLSSSGTVAWTTSIAGAAPCPDDTSSVAVTAATGKLLFTLAATAELFAYLADGTPIAALVLDGNNSDASGVPPTEAAGLFVPLSDVAVTGDRSLLLTRFYTGPDGGPPLRALADVFVLAVDARSASVDRLDRPWRLRLPLPPVLAACLPVPDGSALGSEALRVAGPMLIPSASDALTVMLVGLSCSGGSPANTTLFAVDVGGAHPALLWTSTVVGGDDASLLRSGAPAPVGVAALVLDPRTPASTLRSATAEVGVWLAAPRSGSIVQLVLAAGGSAGARVVGAVDLRAALTGAPRSACPFSVSAPRASAIAPTSDIVAFTPDGGSTGPASLLVFGVEARVGGAASFWVVGLDVASHLAVWCTNLTAPLTGQAVWTTSGGSAGALVVGTAESVNIYDLS